MDSKNFKKRILLAISISVLSCTALMPGTGCECLKKQEGIAKEVLEGVILAIYLFHGVNLSDEPIPRAGEPAEQKILATPTGSNKKNITDEGDTGEAAPAGGHC